MKLKYFTKMDLWEDIRRSVLMSYTWLCLFLAVVRAWRFPDSADYIVFIVLAMLCFDASTRSRS